MLGKITSNRLLCIHPDLLFIGINVAGLHGRVAAVRLIGHLNSVKEISMTTLFLRCSRWLKLMIGAGVVTLAVGVLAGSG